MWKDRRRGGHVVARTDVEIVERDDYDCDPRQIPKGSIIKVIAFEEHPFQEFVGTVQSSSPDDRSHYLDGRLWPPNMEGGWPILNQHCEIIRLTGEYYAN